MAAFVFSAISQFSASAYVYVFPSVHVHVNLLCVSIPVVLYNECKKDDHGQQILREELVDYEVCATESCPGVRATFMDGRRSKVEHPSERVEQGA